MLLKLRRLELLKEKKYYHDYCTGCGLCCQFSAQTYMRMEADGFLYPDFNDENILTICRDVCPVNGNEVNYLSNKEIWGHYINTYLGWSTDEKIRFVASSGGTITTLCSFLLDSKKVDGIIQFAGSSSDVTFGKVYCTTETKELIERCGSRYCSSCVFQNFSEYLMDDNTYAFIGKPCDVRVLHNFLQKHPTYKNKFKYVISFFCAGASSENANLLLLKKLNCNKKEECTKRQYRGNGWPGYAIAWNGDAVIGQIDYQSCWKNTLGRDIRKICRFCIDGVGELADISCGDAWYINDGVPDFSEHDGRNIIFTRTIKGEQLLLEAVQNGYIVVKSDVSFEKLKAAQRYQFLRKAAMKYRILALKVTLRKSPKYPLRFFGNFNQLITTKEKVKIFYGTVKRIVQGKI